MKSNTLNNKPLLRRPRNQLKALIKTTLLLPLELLLNLTKSKTDSRKLVKKLELLKTNEDEKF